MLQHDVVKVDTYKVILCPHVPKIVWWCVQSVELYPCQDVSDWGVGESSDTNSVSDPNNKSETGKTEIGGF